MLCAGLGVLGLACAGTKGVCSSSFKKNWGLLVLWEIFFSKGTNAWGFCTWWAVNGGPSFLTQMCAQCPSSRMAFWWEVDTIYESSFPSLWQSRVDATNHLTKLKEESRVDWIGHAMYPGPDMVVF